MKTILHTSAGQPTSAAYKLREAGVRIGARNVPVEFVVGARPRSIEQQPGRRHHIAFCSSVMRRFGDRLNTCEERVHSGGASLPHDMVNTVILPPLALDGEWNGTFVLHGFALVSRTGPDNVVTFDRVICAEALDLNGTGFDGDQCFEFEGGVEKALQCFARRNSDNPRVGALLNRRSSVQGLDCRRMVGSSSALFRAGGQRVIAVDRYGHTDGKGAFDSIPLAPQILSRIPRRFFGAPTIQPQREEVLAN